MLSLASWGWADEGIGISHWGCQKLPGAERGSQPQCSLSSAHPALSLQPGKLTEAFKYFLQGMGYSECWDWVWGWCGSVCVLVCMCADLLQVCLSVCLKGCTGSVCTQMCVQGLCVYICVCQAAYVGVHVCVCGHA